MVMATPSPQQVGREFVRQYYTVLHEAPQVLHRFYSSGSTFVHGGVDRPGLSVEEPVVGQLEIDKKIKLLNFKDCHTKIRQVDSQATIGNGVVVQVTGELSNNGEPMRRFMQTFVLAPQTPKKYYVHNDIFRYQDEVYQDNSDSESEESTSHHHNQQVESNSTTSSSSASTAPATTTSTQKNFYQNENHDDLINSQTTATTNNSDHQEVVHSNENKEHGTSMVNGHSHVASEGNEQKLSENVNEITQQMTQMELKNNETTDKNVVAESVTDTKEEPVNNNNNKQESSDGKSNSWAQIINRSGDSVATTASSQNQQQQFHSSMSGSSMLSKVGGSGVPSKEQQNFQQQNGTQMNTTSNSTKNQNNSKPRTGPAAPTSSSSSSSQRGGLNSAPTTQTATTNNNVNSNQNNNGNTSDLDDDKRFGRYLDNQQVFVGNLSQDLSETELKQFFNQFGKVLEVRINSNNKQQSGRRLPNYGFVVFEDKHIVDALLGSSKSNNLTYKNDKGVEFRLNVEEKRARLGRMSSGFGGSSKSNRATRSTSNGSRGGGHNNKKNNDSNFVGDNKNNAAFVDVNHRNKNNFRRS